MPPSSWLVNKLHNVPRKDAYYRSLPNNFNIKSSDYVDGVVLVAVYHFYWLAAALLVIPLAFLRAYRMDPRGNIHEALYRCVWVCLAALIACFLMELVAVRASAASLDLRLNTRDHQFARKFLFNVHDKANEIKKRLLAPLPLKPEDVSSQQAVHQLVSSLTRGTDDLVAHVRDHSYTGAMLTPMAKEIWNTQWLYFVGLTAFWCCGIFFVGVLAICKKPYTAAVLGVIWCCAGAAVLTCAALASADACCDPDTVTEQLVIKNVETTSMIEEYQRVCKEWFTGAVKLYETYQEGFHKGESRLNAGLGQDYSLYRASVTKRIRDICLKELVDFRRTFVHNNCEEATLVQKDLGNEAVKRTCEDDVALQVKIFQGIALSLVGVFFVMFLLYITMRLRPDGKCPCWRPPPLLTMPFTCPGPPPNLRNRVARLSTDAPVPLAELLSNYVDGDDDDDSKPKKKGPKDLGIPIGPKGRMVAPSFIIPSKGSGLCRGTVDCPGTKSCRGPITCPGAIACPGPKLGEDYCACKKHKERTQVIYIKQPESAKITKPVVLKVDEEGHVRAELNLVADQPVQPTYFERCMNSACMKKMCKKKADKKDDKAPDDEEKPEGEESDEQVENQPVADQPVKRGCFARCIHSACLKTMCKKKNDKKQQENTSDSGEKLDKASDSAEKRKKSSDSGEKPNKSTDSGEKSRKKSAS